MSFINLQTIATIGLYSQTVINEDLLFVEFLWVNIIGWYE